LILLLSFSFKKYFSDKSFRLESTSTTSIDEIFSSLESSAGSVKPAAQITKIFLFSDLFCKIFFLISSM
jgi:hypothetical protein